MSHEDLLRQLPVKYDLRDKRRKTFLKYLRSKFPTPGDLASTIRRFPMLRAEHFESLHRLHKNIMAEICHGLKSQGTPVDLSLVFKKASREAFKLKSGKDSADYPEAYGLMVSMFARERARSLSQGISIQQELFEEKLVEDERRRLENRRDGWKEARIFFMYDEPYARINRAK